MHDDNILVINAGSSSLKLGLYAQHAPDPQLLFDGLADGIGKDTGKLTLRDATGKTLREEQLHLATLPDALKTASAWLEQVAPAPVAVGHRVVHGGPRLTKHQLITPEVIAELNACIHFAPLHIPPALKLIEQATHTYPHAPQYACFDTAFHTTLPETACRFALPRELFDQGIRRYGFHGLSYESIVYQLSPGVPARLVVAHLGSGASLAAIAAGHSVDTSMGLTPTGGIPMGTRSGDLDPGVLLYLMRARSMDADALEHMLNHDSGLTGISGGESDMRKLTEQAGQGSDPARIAIEIFCIAIAKTIAAYACVLGGLDLIVFTGGIGQHSADVRARVCDRLQFLGVALADEPNRSSANVISSQSSTVPVRVLESQEDIQIARHCVDLMRSA